MTNNLAWHKLLQNILVREGHSLLQFLVDAYPWTRPEEQPLLEQIQKMIAEEKQAAANLAGFLRRQRIPLPYVGPYPNRYLNLLFVSLDFLLPRLVAHQQEAIAQLEQDLKAIPDLEARRQVESLLAVKSRHLKKLKELAARAAKPVHA